MRFWSTNRVQTEVTEHNHQVESSGVYLLFHLFAFCINIESNQILFFLLGFKVVLEIIKYNFTCLLYRTASTVYLFDWIKVEFMVPKIRRQRKNGKWEESSLYIRIHMTSKGTIPIYQHLPTHRKLYAFQSKDNFFILADFLYAFIVGCWGNWQQALSVMIKLWI